MSSKFELYHEWSAKFWIRGELLVQASGPEVGTNDCSQQSRALVCRAKLVLIDLIVDISDCYMLVFELLISKQIQ